MQKLLFSPGPVPQKWELEITFSHRSSEFSKLYNQTRELVSTLVGGMKVLFVQGSGSAAIEAVLSSLPVGNKTIGIWSTGIFSKRAAQVAAIYNDVASLEENLDKVDRNLGAVYAVQFETSESRYIDVTNLSKKCKELGIILIVDIISAFPFYSKPDADILILSSAKQFRGLPVMGIVAYKKEIEFKVGVAEYLSLRNYESYSYNNQTPHTSLIPQIGTLFISLKNSIWVAGVEAIKKNAALLNEALPFYRMIGDKEAPVLTFKTDKAITVSETLKEKNIEIYLNASYMADRFQVSCFNYAESGPYEQLAEELRRLDKEGKL